MEETTQTAKTTNLAKALAIFMLVFGFLTIKSGGSVLFIESVRALAGDYILPIVWFNFVGGFFLALGAIGLWLGKGWVKPVAMVLFASFLVMDCYLAFHIYSGGAFMEKTVVAMFIRTLTWAFANFLATKAK